MTRAEGRGLNPLSHPDVISLFISEEECVGLYGELDTPARDWLPWSYTNLLEENEKETVTLAPPCSTSKRKKKHQPGEFI
uniref:Uncharacterized protein n=1 Tax=Mustela putorius furo TaxID=9669 RepID=M3Y3G1_MUSPF